jgi:hypothetical protein
MYIIVALRLRGLFSFRTPTEHHTHPTLEITVIEARKFFTVPCTASHSTTLDREFLVVIVGSNSY